MTALADMLPGGGEMGALIRARDWSATPLGPPQHWPQSLRTSLSIMLESKFAMVVAWGPEHRFFYNDRYRPVLGTKHPASLGTPGAEIFPEVWDMVGPEFDRVLRGEAFAIDDWLLPLDRYGYLENCWFTVSYSPIRDETSGVAGVLAVVAETTGRVQSERRLATLRELARTSDARTREDVCRRAARTFEGNPLDVPFSIAYLLDAEGKRAHLVASSHIEAGESATPYEIDLASDSPDGWPIHTAIANRDTVVVENISSRFGLLPGGVEGEASHSAVVLPLIRSGASVAYGALVLGVSPRRALDERYREFMELAAEHVVAGLATAAAHEEERERAEQLEELNRAKTAFFSNVSHEFRTPLTLLLGPVHELLASQSTSDADKRNVEVIERNSQRLLKLVNTLLDFSRIEAGRMQPHFAPVDLARATADVASSFRATIERAGLKLRVECDPLPQPVYVDRGMWEKVMLNLLSNAFKHTFDGTITVTVSADGDVARVKVKDTGIGIPAQHLPRVFERFHQVPAARSRTHEGSGIGLSLVRELVRLHGGDVSVTSSVGKTSGSEFTVTLAFGHGHLPAGQVVDASEAKQMDEAIASPYVKEAERWTGATPEPETTAVAQGAALENTRILVVDDNADMRDYLARMLTAAGAQVLLARNGREALVRLHSPAEHVDVVLSDVMMPEMDGFALLAALRSHETLRTMPFIVLSARAGEESRVEGMAAGADDYLVKPFVSQEVIARVAGQLRLAKARAAERVARADAESARKQMASVFEQAPMPICVIEGAELRYTTANAHYRQLIGNRDPVGKTLLELWPELKDSDIHRIMSSVISTGRAQSAAEFPVRFDQFGEGEPREAFFNFVYHPLRDGAGRTYGLIAIATDVTAHVLARREAERLRDAAESANEAKLHLLRTVSHETRQPVHASLGYVDLLLLGLRGDIENEQRRFLENIRRNQMHLLRLLNDILSFAKLEAGVLDLDVERVDAAWVLAGLEPLVRPQFQAKQVEYSMAASDDPAEFTGDRERTIQICINLLTNALKATPSLGRVTITTQVHDGLVQFVVADTGIGIPADKLEEIFEPFATLARRPQSEGAGVGLGLSISRQLARAMGGDVTVESRVGQGSTFTLSLPRVA
ncbi:MAG TPA: ATP-binding protein [Gemmatimonadaceae bacterium]|nr:ATP-binding protein [Gemmatimonadaceae bacterium]